jgi:hypothetical protein
MKVYIIIDRWLDGERHEDYCDCFASAEEALKYVADNQKDGHKLVVVEKEFDDPYAPQYVPQYVPICPCPQTPTVPYPQPISPYYTTTCSVEQRKEADNE